MTVPEHLLPLFHVTTLVVGLLVGSFLNVAIHRLPLEGESVAHPRRSRCPKCRRQLTWIENIPLLSWILQGGRCRGCRVWISVRYPLVELLTASLWIFTAWWVGFESWDLLLVHLVVVSGLIVATFVDFDCFEIPDEISIGGMFLAPVASLAVPALHGSTWVAAWMSGVDLVPGATADVDRTGALVGCLAGMAAGGGSLLLIGWLGSRIYKRDAMGFGDVKLLAAGGGFVGPGGVLVALMIASVIASVVGVANMVRFFCLARSRVRRRGAKRPLGRTLQVARVAGRYIPFGPYLGMGVGIVLYAWKDVVQWLPW
jgi:leader peptidase (prepilin peptidase)/N-methyltransferase